MNYVKKAPISFGGLAHADEATARVLGFRARADFNLDPRREAHDERTWRLMAPGSLFSREVDRFIDEGVPRNSLATPLLEEIAIFRVIMMLETIMEQRHAIASVTVRRHFIGPVRLSLSNRLPMLERWVRLGQVSGAEVLEAFSESLQLLRQPDHVGVGLHSLLNTAHTPATMRVNLAKVIYRCSLEDMCASQAGPKKHHDSEKDEGPLKTLSYSRKMQLQSIRTWARPKQHGVSYTLVVRESMNDHLRHAFDSASGHDDDAGADARG